MSATGLRTTIAAFAGLSLLGLAACTTDNAFGVFSATSQAAGDVSTAPLEASASADGTKASASVTVAQGTTLISSTGQVLDASDVSMTVEAFDGSQAAESQFEGGVTFTDQDTVAQIANALNRNIDSSRNATIDVAGYAVINVRAGGQEVTQFDPPLTITIATPDQAPGSTVAIITVNETTGARRFEGTATVRSNRTVVISLDHLTVVAAVGGVTGTLSGGGGGK